ncbi:MAG: CDP-diacylglycerol--glycerol-3-phosphate 3-phosphatidyltransferase [Deltaproteobacteria bacterium]|nr:CDP-diacylglycerol--glycerol-3-phosphate 3-phosphatidyltransferase [Deltaproteobacteria bacterium]
MSSEAQITSTSGPDKKTVRRSTREEFTNLPNLLTLMRIALIPPVMILMVEGTPKSGFYAAILCSIAAITDWLDGWLARRRGLESLVGKLLDPLADKLLVMAILVMATQLGRIPGWFAVLLLAREITITGLRALAAQEGLTVSVIEAGKWKTALQLTGIIGLLVYYTYAIPFGFGTYDVNFGALGIGLLALAMIFSVVSAISYFVSFMGAIAETKDLD